MHVKFIVIRNFRVSEHKDYALSVSTPKRDNGFHWLAWLYIYKSNERDLRYEK